MTGNLVEAAFIAACAAVMAAAAVALLGWLVFVRPRVGLYTIFAAAPTQFIFIPAGSFFISPADVLVLAAGVGLLARLASGGVRARNAIRLHALLGVMIAAYLVGFLILDHYSRTLIRVPLAIVPSILACELLEERKHFKWAIGALVTAALLDAGYGIYFLSTGERLHPTRFSGMMGVNFSAIAFMTAAAMTFARWARTRDPLTLLLPGALALLGLATLSKMGVIALVLAAGLIGLRVATPKNRALVLTVAALLFVIAAGQGAIRERVLARTTPELQLDGVERTSTDVRILINGAAWQAFGQQPITGIGYYNFEPYSRRNPAIYASTGGAGYATHNTYLEVLVEGGILAFVPFLLHFLAYPAGLTQMWRAVRAHDVVAAAILAGFVVVIVSAAAANLLLHYLFWSVCGLALACVERLREQDAERGTTSYVNERPRRPSASTRR